MTGKLLDIAQTTADFSDFSGCAGDDASLPEWLEQPTIPRSAYRR
jgi:hypothetical protein